jgi:hypothetical protein
MKQAIDTGQHAKSLLPLLGAIGREIQERSERLAVLEAEIEAASSCFDEELLHQRVAEAAAHRRGLRLAKAELERLGCSVVGMAPLTIRIRDERSKRSFVWKTGDLLPR